MSSTADTTTDRPDDHQRRSFLVRLLLTPVSDALRGRLQPRVTWPQQVRAAGLPSSLEQLVLETAKGTRLWRSEQADVAEELIAHFADGLDAGLSADELTRRFGDRDQAARLIRRAKKRNRPFLWRAVRRSVQSIALLLLMCAAVYLVLAARYYFASPTIGHDYLADLNAAALDTATDERAWPLYRDALIALEPWRHQKTDPHPRPGDARWDEYAAWLESNATALDLARRASQRPLLGYVASPDLHDADRELWPERFSASQQAVLSENLDDVLQGSLISVQLPYLGTLRQLSMVMLDDARRLVVEERDGAVATETLLAVARLAEQLAEPATVISDLVSLACMAAANDAAGEFLQVRPEVFSDQDLLAIAHGFAAFRGGEIRVRVESERMMFRDILQRMYTDDGSGDGYMTAQGLRAFAALSHGTFIHDASAAAWMKEAAGPLLSVAIVGRREMFERYDELLNAAVIESQQPLWQRRSANVEATVEQMYASPVDRVRYLPIVLLMPALSKAAIHGELLVMRRDAVLVAIALELHRRRHGDWPNSLKELTPHLLPAVPPDRFTGAPIGYVVRDGEPFVYSVGSDLQDQGGTPVKRADGRPDYDAASRWFGPDRIAALRVGQSIERGRPASHTLPEGDWIIWPPQPPAATIDATPPGG